ncbi:MAG: hypothetical protein ABIA63_01935 [bacterium]
MDKQSPSNFFSKDAWKAIIVATFIVVLAGGALAWQYRNLAEKSGGELSSLEDIIEQSLAQNVLDDFMTARINKNEAQSMTYLTEAAMEQKIANDFTLINNFESYSVFKSEEMAKDKYRFIVKVSEGDKSGEIMESIIFVKIIDRYYKDSVQITG